MIRQKSYFNEQVGFVLALRPGLSTANLSPPAMLRQRAAVGERLTMDNPTSTQI